MKRLAVYLHGERAGTLSQDNSGLLSFSYTPEWLAQPTSRPLSRSLPLQELPFKGKKARPFFSGILPEEAVRQQIAAILGISENNDFAMLARIGGECAGAVCLLPDGEAPPLASCSQAPHELSDAELATVIAELPRRPLLAGRDGLRLSLAGAQNKLPIVMHGRAVALPLGNTPSTHIIKPEPEHFPGLVANEIFCMTLAGAIGLNVPAISQREIGGRACAVVQRYDRVAGTDGVVRRMHQEDFCQALGLPPERKYQQEGGPLLRDCVSLLRDWSTAPVLDIREFLDAVIFNVFIGNADAHGKNFSWLYHTDSRRLAPRYDLVCTLAWPELSSTPAMKVGGGNAITAITAKHWQQMTEEMRLGWPMVRERLDELARKTTAALQSSAVREAVANDRAYDRLTAIVAAQIAVAASGA